MRAQVAPARHAVAATAADHVALAGDDLPGVEVVDVRADFYDFTDEFMADDHWDRDGLGRPLVPQVNMQVGTANRRLDHPDQNIVHSHFRLRNIFQPDSFSSFPLN